MKKTNKKISNKVVYAILVTIVFTWSFSPNSFKYKYE